MRYVAIAVMLSGLCGSAAALNSADIALANSYDDAWEYDWASTMKAVHDNFTGTASRVIHIGDSITYSNPFSQWVRYGAGRTTQDNAVRTYCGVDAQNENDGNYLAYWDGDSTAPYNQSTNGSFTAETGMDAAEFLSGPPNGLPTCNEMFVTGTGTDGNYNNFTGSRAAEVCFLMLGTNDVSGGRTAAAVRADLIQIITKMMQNNNTIVCLSTIPPHIGNQTLAQQVNTEIRDIAQNGLVISGVNGGATVYFPLIDFYEAIVYRRSSDWNGTLMTFNDVHPSATVSDGDPYASGGANLSDGGYLLRCWLWVQKFKEIKEYCIDGNLPGPTAPVANAGPDKSNVAASSTVQLTGAASTGATTYAWAFLGDGNTSATLSNANIVNPTFTTGTPGLSYHLQLTVTDGGSLTDTDDMWVWVDPAYAAAVITGPTTVLPGAAVTLSATGSWTWNGSSGYAWTVVPAPGDLTSTTAASISFTAGVLGDSYAVTLTVDDGLGHDDVANGTVDVGGLSGGTAGVSCAPNSHTSSGMLFPVLILIVTLGLRRCGARPGTKSSVYGERIGSCRECEAHSRGSSASSR